MTRELVKIGTGQTKDIPVLQAEDLSKFIIYIDEPDANTAYYGFAEPGSSTSDPVWRIMKKVVSGTVTAYLWADGDTNFDNVWDSRASLSYS
ncbi:MAG TPA: hypothetical protein ENL09_00310 [Bacteroidetes bacterium]|nr:hypothetical protein [Bacteroidota bacterium]